MTAITDMALPYEVAIAMREARRASLQRPVIEAEKFIFRAALQAMLDNGMATVGKGIDEVKNVYPAIIIRLDADERERASK